MEHVPEFCAMTKVMYSKTNLVSIFVYHEILMSGWYGVLGEDNQLVRTVEWTDDVLTVLSIIKHQPNQS